MQNTVHTDILGKSMGTKEKWKIQIRKYTRVEFELMHATKVSCNVVLLEISIC